MYSILDQGSTLAFRFVRVPDPKESMQEPEASRHQPRMMLSHLAALPFHQYSFRYLGPSRTPILKRHTTTGGRGQDTVGPSMWAVWTYGCLLRAAIPHH